MKLPAIKLLVDQYDLHTLVKAEENLLDEQAPGIDIDGQDEGEQLTHVMAAIWIKDQMERQNWDYKTALREYTKKVRLSIS